MATQRANVLKRVREILREYGIRESLINSIHVTTIWPDYRGGSVPVPVGLSGAVYVRIFFPYTDYTNYPESFRISTSKKDYEYVSRYIADYIATKLVV